jgi:hypothetical protein
MEEMKIITRRQIVRRIATVGALAGILMIAPYQHRTHELYDTGSTGFVSTLNLGNGNYSTQWDILAGGNVVSQTNGLTLALARGVPGDLFQLLVINNDGSTWNFTVSINGGAQTLGPISIVHGNSFHFSFALLASLSQVDLTVGQTMPIINASGEDRGAESRLANVPDGAATLSLLGVLLFGIGALRRRFNV